MAVQAMTLGALLRNFSHDLVSLIQSTNDIVRKKQLRDELEELHDLVGQLVDANVNKATPEYLAATMGLQAGTAAIHEAQEDIAKIAQTIANVAKALDVLEQLAKKAAGI